MNTFILYGTNDGKSAEVLAVTPYSEMVDRIQAISDYKTFVVYDAMDEKNLPRVGEIVTKFKGSLICN